MTNSLSKPVSFKVGHRPSKTMHNQCDVYVVISCNHGVDRVEFRRFGALLFQPLCTATKPVHLKKKRDGTDYFFYFRGFERPKRAEVDSSLVIKIVLRSGAMKEIWYDTNSPDGGQITYPDAFMAPRLKWTEKLSVSKLPSRDHTFGVELEMSDRGGATNHVIAKAIWRRTGEKVNVVDAYSEAHKKSSTWKLVPDGSIQCSRVAPGCNKFELVSPILCGEDGLLTCQIILDALKRSSSTDILVNKTMGFHVHVGVKDCSLDDLKRICLNFVKYEEAIDLFMPRSRRSESSNKYCRSCRDNIRNPGGTIARQNGGRHRAIMSCTTIASLCHLMNPEGRYYKLNMTNLVTGRQPTLEFRQHSATCNADKVLAWIRFCVTFVRNSIRNPTPEYLKNNLEPEEIFDHLFQDLIQCTVLENFYAERMDAVASSSNHRASCCSGCQHGRGCATRNYD